MRGNQPESASPLSLPDQKVDKESRALADSCLSTSRTRHRLWPAGNAERGTHRLWPAGNAERGTHRLWPAGNAERGTQTSLRTTDITQDCWHHLGLITMIPVILTTVKICFCVGCFFLCSKCQEVLKKRGQVNAQTTGIMTRK